jgi:hypothetical protein
MKSFESPRSTPQIEIDRRMLDWLREQFAGSSEADAAIARFSELLESQNTWLHMLETIKEAHKLAIKQLEYAQSAIRALERQVQSLVSEFPSNGNVEWANPNLPEWS